MAVMASIMFVGRDVQGGDGGLRHELEQVAVEERDRVVGVGAVDVGVAVRAVGADDVTGGGVTAGGAGGGDALRRDRRRPDGR